MTSGTKVVSNNNIMKDKRRFNILLNRFLFPISTKVGLICLNDA